MNGNKILIEAWSLLKFTFYFGFNFTVLLMVICMYQVAMFLNILFIFYGLNRCVIQNKSDEYKGTDGESSVLYISGQ